MVGKQPVKAVHDDAPLFTKAADEAAANLAKLRSLTPAATGLGKRRHNAMVRLLETLSNDSFSDGTTTLARSKVIAKSIGKDRSTIFRRIRDAAELGLLATTPREGAVGQRTSSQRSIVWERVDELVTLGRELIAKAKAEAKAAAENSPPKPLPRLPIFHATGASQMRRGSRKCDGVVANATPNNPYSPDTTDNLKTSGCADVLRSGFDRTIRPISRDDQSPRPAPRHVVAADSIATDAARAFAALRYHGDQGQSVWAAVAAAKAGVIDEASLWRAIGRAADKRDPVAYFRTVLAEGLGVELPELQRLLRTVAVSPRLPAEPPAPKPRPAKHIRPTIRGAPRDDTAARTETARRRILAELAAMDV